VCQAVTFWETLFCPKTICVCQSTFSLAIKFCWARIQCTVQRAILASWYLLHYSSAAAMSSMRCCRLEHLLLSRCVDLSSIVCWITCSWWALIWWERQKCKLMITLRQCSSSTGCDRHTPRLQAPPIDQAALGGMCKSSYRAFVFQNDTNSWLHSHKAKLTCRMARQYPW